ncbi:MAG TPA: hypothetical protein VGH11_06835 [Jatrophihabitans sp.]|jgi:hypothetical protein
MRRFALGSVAAVLVIVAAVVAFQLHQHFEYHDASGQHAQLTEMGKELSQIQSILSGSTLPPGKATCRINGDRARAEGILRVPRSGTADWNVVMSACTHGNS